MKMKSVLLAGATGYLGSYIAGELRKRDYLVRVMAMDMVAPEFGQNTLEDFFSKLKSPDAQPIR